MNQTLPQPWTHRRLIVRLLAGVVAMFGFGYALVPLYNVFCDITGLNGKTRNEAVARSEMTGEIDTNRTVTIEFLANLNGSAPWTFKPQVPKMEIHPGQFYQTTYIATNRSDQPRVAQAVPSVSPGEAALLLQKVECFCFSRQEFKAGERLEMPVVFRLDPKLPTDINTLTLSYTFFEVPEASP